MVYSINAFPTAAELETTAVLKKLATAHRFLANLKGVAATIPNESILINTLSLQEAKDSSAIENIITTHDELYKAQLFQDLFDNASAKEVSNYADALKGGFELVRKNRILSLNHILQIQKTLEQNDAGLRKLPGTALVNQATGETVYTPPRHPDEVESLMWKLVNYMNSHEEADADPLIKMAVIHHQFESIHPFYDGNGRTGRIINILYLVMNELLDLPVLYLSRFIIRQKGDYYRLLQEVRDKGAWTDWVLFMLSGVEETAKERLS
jgi:Fic family protein